MHNKRYTENTENTGNIELIELIGVINANLLDLKRIGQNRGEVLAETKVKQEIERISQSLSSIQLQNAQNNQTLILMQTLLTQLTQLNQFNQSQVIQNDEGNTFSRNLKQNGRYGKKEKMLAESVGYDVEKTIIDKLQKRFTYQYEKLLNREITIEEFESYREEIRSVVEGSFNGLETFFNEN